MDVLKLVFGTVYICSIYICIYCGIRRCYRLTPLFEVSNIPKTECGQILPHLCNQSYDLH